MATNETKTEKTVKIRIPLTRENTSDVFVNVNGRTWLIKRGETVEVPEIVAEVLHHQEQAEAKAFAYENEVQK